MAHHKSFFTVSDFVDMVETGEFDRADVFSALLMKMVVIMLRIVRMKTKEVSINISLLFGLYFNDFGSWAIARGEGGYKWVHFSLLHTTFF